MLPRTRRLTTHMFDQAMLEGKVFHSPFFTLAAVKVGSENAKEIKSAKGSRGKKAELNRFAAVAPKKYFKTAVERNAIRRKVYAAMDGGFLERIDSNFNKAFFNSVVMAKPSVLNLKKSDTTAALIELFVKSRIIT